MAGGGAKGSAPADRVAATGVTAGAAGVDVEEEEGTIVLAGVTTVGEELGGGSSAGIDAGKIVGIIGGADATGVVGVGVAAEGDIAGFVGAMNPA
ncbi:hypothetical protein PTI98_008985 [Pleurotus ostreatus]|nr:hypothetical protein PTI98_008985 [Pleurotus ostreatus]